MVEEKEDQDMFEAWRKLEFKIDENYVYITKGIHFNICSNILYYFIAYPILKILIKIIYDLKIVGKENIKNLNCGAISVSNHVLVLDCAMVGLACGKKSIYYTTLESQFKIPFVRKLIKLLRAIPIPSGIKGKKNFLKSIEKLLKEDNIVHFYPEKNLLPYCNYIRKFENGAFEIAIKNKVPVVPIVFTFREPKGIRKIIKRKKDVTITVLPPIKTNGYKENIKEDTIKLRDKVLKEMNEVIMKK